MTMKTNYQMLLRNFQAGTTTAILLIPQSMAYALVAGVPPIYGLYATLLPLVADALTDLPPIHISDLPRQP